MSMTREITDYSEAEATEHGLTEPFSQPQVKFDPKDLPNTVAATFVIQALVIKTTVTVATLDGHSGEGSARGIGIGGSVIAGVLLYGSWETLTGDENTINVYALKKTLYVDFFIGSIHVARFLGAGFGDGIDVASGTFNWKY
ncbi:hypothetical protein BV25DRAFT_1822045 [Artomyces pyxidatus]|uniref:Uncharacterized protein n=1 Tax=Artomyces pyxidatus TaxID=48021 RepID=A0ACB8TB90_9AGAM|nr:hypothetical protein BV25DRAFT_1822045 [Artomyces pyxidatus]